MNVDVPDDLSVAARKITKGQQQRRTGDKFRNKNIDITKKKKLEKKEFIILWVIKRRKAAENIFDNRHNENRGVQ